MITLLTSDLPTWAIIATIIVFSALIVFALAILADIVTDFRFSDMLRARRANRLASTRNAR